LSAIAGLYCFKISCGYCNLFSKNKTILFLSIYTREQRQRDDGWASGLYSDYIRPERRSTTYVAFHRVNLSFYHLAMPFGQLISGKIINIVAIREQT